MWMLQWLVQSFFLSVLYLQNLHLYFLGGRDGIDGGGGGGTGAIEEEDVTVSDGADFLVERAGLDVITTWGCNAGIWYDVG